MEENSVVTMEAVKNCRRRRGDIDNFWIYRNNNIQTPQGIVGFGHGIGSSASSFMIPAKVTMTRISEHPSRHLKEGPSSGLNS